MKNTGTFATKDQIDRVQTCAKMPQIALQCGLPASAGDAAHAVAIELGLPEIPGRYGIDLSTGEILAPDGDVED